MGPGRVLHTAVLHRLPLDAVEYEDDRHHCRGHNAPTGSPVPELCQGCGPRIKEISSRVWFEACHLFNAAGEFVDSEDPADCDGLEEAAPQNWDAAGAVKVHQLEDISSSLKKRLIMNERNWDKKL